jgi:hypothetical protein
MTSEMQKHFTNGIFKTRAGFMGVSDALRDKLTYFKPIVAPRQSAMNLLRTHNEIRSYS